MKYIIAIIFLVTPIFSYGNSFECENLVGKWRLDDYDETLVAQRESYFEYKRDNSFRMISVQESGSETWIQSESGSWVCDGKFITLTTLTVNGVPVNYVDEYEIIELTTTYWKIMTKYPDCEGVISDCPKIYSSVKWE